MRGLFPQATPHPTEFAADGGDAPCPKGRGRSNRHRIGGCRRSESLFISSANKKVRKRPEFGRRNMSGNAAAVLTKPAFRKIEWLEREIAGERRRGGGTASSF